MNADDEKDRDVDGILQTMGLIRTITCYLGGFVYAPIALYSPQKTRLHLNSDLH